MEINQIFDNVYSRLENELPYYLYYHSPEHTLNVIKRSEFLANTENLSEKEIDLIRVAALYHDAGFLIGREDHETKSCKLASKELPKYGFSEEQIQNICGMINATRIPQKTHNLNEQIVADADLFYLGTNEYDLYSQQLYKELKHIYPEIDERKWFEIQLNFLEEHKYHTNYAKEVLAPIKKINMAKLLKSQDQLLNG
ncbi:MAG: HD domain-containing protein [Christiangramia sp.]|nr:HD domain-containing protein [Christiangramia sp.]